MQLEEPGLTHDIFSQYVKLPLCMTAYTHKHCVQTSLVVVETKKRMISYVPTYSSPLTQLINYCSKCVHSHSLSLIPHSIEER